MKRLSKELVKSLEALGFDHVWTNTQGYPCYVHPSDPTQHELSISPSIANDQTARILLRRAQKIAGVTPHSTKRRASQVKERTDADRERAQRRLAWAREKERRTADQAEREQLQTLIEQRARELEALERLMKQPAQGGRVHRGCGQARHWAGASS